MSLLDYFRQEYVKGKVVDKYSLKNQFQNGNIGLIIEDYNSHDRYHVEFKDGYKGPRAENLFSLVKDPFSNKTEYLDKLIKKNDSVELTVSYSKGPLREAYYINSVSAPAPYKLPRKMMSLPYESARVPRY